MGGALLAALASAGAIGACGSSARQQPSAATGGGGGGGGGFPDAGHDGAGHDGAGGSWGDASGSGCDAGAPVVATVTPDPLITFAKDVPIDITGNGFTQATTVTFNGSPLATSNVTLMHIGATIPAALLAQPGVMPLVVANGGCDATVNVPVRSPWSIAAAGWPRHHHDNQNTSASSAVVAASPKLYWSKPTAPPSSGVLGEGGGFWSAPVAAAPFGEMGESVFVGGPNGDAFAFHADGTARYQFTGHGPAIYGIDGVGAVRADGIFYAGDSDANLYAIALDGTELWTYTTGQTSDASPAILEDGTIVYASDDDKVYALHPDGSVLWSSAALGEVDSALATTHQDLGDVGMLAALVVYAGGSNGWFCLAGATGAVKWTVAATGPRSATVSSPVIGPGGEMYGVDSGGLAVRIDTSGKLVWQRQLAGGGGVTPALSGGHLHFVGGDGKLYVISAQDGSDVWSADVHGAAANAQGENATPSIDGAGNVFVYSAADGQIWRFDSAGNPLAAIPVSAPMNEFVVPQVAIGAGGTLYVSSSDGQLRAFQ